MSNAVLDQSLMCYVIKHRYFCHQGKNYMELLPDLRVWDPANALRSPVRRLRRSGLVRARSHRGSWTRSRPPCSSRSSCTTSEASLIFINFILLICFYVLLFLLSLVGKCLTLYNCWGWVLLVHFFQTSKKRFANEEGCESVNWNFQIGGEKTRVQWHYRPAWVNSPKPFLDQCRLWWK